MTILFDLDHTIIKPKSRKVFPINCDDWEFIDLPKLIENILLAIDEDTSKDIKIGIISNQGGISKGYVKVEDFETKINNIINKIKEELLSKGVRIDIIYGYTILVNDKEYGRKPNIGTALELLYKLKCNNINKLIICGDRVEDMELANNLNCEFISAPLFYREDNFNQLLKKISKKKPKWKSTML